MLLDTNNRQQPDHNDFDNAFGLVLTILTLFCLFYALPVDLITSARWLDDTIGVAFSNSEIAFGFLNVVWGDAIIPIRLESFAGSAFTYGLQVYFGLRASRSGLDGWDVRKWSSDGKKWVFFYLAFAAFDTLADVAWRTNNGYNPYVSITFSLLVLNLGSEVVFTHALGRVITAVRGKPDGKKEKRDWFGRGKKKDKPNTQNKRRSTTSRQSPIPQRPQPPRNNQQPLVASSRARRLPTRTVPINAGQNRTELGELPPPRNSHVSG